MANEFHAHMFRRRNLGEREEVKLKLFDKEGNPADLSGGGDQKVEVVLGREEILALSETPYEIIAPTWVLDEENSSDWTDWSPPSFPLIMSARFSLVNGETGYGNFSASQVNAMRLCYGSNQSFDCGFVSGLTFPTQSEARIAVSDMKLIMGFAAAEGRWRIGKFYTDISPSRPEWQDNGLYLYINTPGVSGPLTGGDEIDKLTVSVMYDTFELLR